MFGAARAVEAATTPASSSVGANNVSRLHGWDQIFVDDASVRRGVRGRRSEGQVRAVRSIGWKGALLAVGIVLLVGGGAGAALCKLTNLNCHLRKPGQPRVSRGRRRHDGASRGIRTASLRRRRPVLPDGFRLPTGRADPDLREGRARSDRSRRIREELILDLRPNVNRWEFRGLMNVTVDPEFETQPFVYIMYATRGVAVDSSEPTAVRVSRFTVKGGKPSQRASASCSALGPIGRVRITSKARTAFRPKLTMPAPTSSLRATERCSSPQAKEERNRGDRVCSPGSRFARQEAAPCRPRRARAFGEPALER